MPIDERALFDQALEITDLSARIEFVRRMCVGRPDLQAAVEALLDVCDLDGSFLETPVIDQLQNGNLRSGRTGASNSNQSQSESDPNDLDSTRQFNQPPIPAIQADPQRSDEIDQGPDLRFLQPSENPRSLGKLSCYDVQRVLGQGAFGIVLKAFDEKLRRHVAIKVLNAELAATSPPRKRFLREARASAAIRHDNVVHVYNVEEYPLPYLVMELIEGETLQQKLKRQGPLEIREILSIGRQIAAGLAAAHAQGLIHRDIKPANILIETMLSTSPSVERVDQTVLTKSHESLNQSGLSLHVKLSDFGLARTADDASLSTSALIAGTPMYMSPEQAQGGTLTPASDLFSLGTVLYEMATGHPPFRAAGVVAVLQRVATATPRAMTESIPELPAWFVEIVAKLHAKDPAHRYRSASEVADVFARWETEWNQHHQVISIPRSTDDIKEQSPAQPKLQRVTRGRTTKLLTALVIISLIAIAWKAGWNSIPTNSPQDGDVPAPSNVAISPENVTTTTDPIVELVPPKADSEKSHLASNDQPTNSVVATTSQDPPAPKNIEPTPQTQVTIPTIKLDQSNVTYDEADWHALKELATAALKLDPVDKAAATARWKLVQFARLHTQTPAGNEALRLISELKWPTDFLRREDIPAYELQVAGHGNPLKAPPELVAIYGDSRWKHWAGVLCVAGTRDGKTIISGGFDKTLMVWDYETGHLKNMLLGHNGMVRSLAISPDDSRVASASWDGTAIVWDLRTGQRLLDMGREQSGISGIAFVDDGHKLVTTTSSGLLSLWDIDQKTRIKSVQTLSNIECLAVSPKENLMAIGSLDGSVRILNSTTFELVPGGQPTNTLNAGIWALAYDAEGKNFAIGDNKGRLQLWEPVKRSVITVPNDVRAIAFDPTGKKVGVASTRLNVYGFDVDPLKRTTTTNLHHTANTIMAHPHTNHWLVGWGNHWITHIDRDSGQITNPEDGPILGFDVSWDGTQVAATHRETNQIAMWNVNAPNKMQHFPRHGAWDTDVVFSPDGRRLISVGGNWICKLWDTFDNKFLGEFGRHTQWIFSANMHPDGTKMVTGSSDKMVRMLNVTHQKSIHLTEAHNAEVGHVRFSVNGQQYVTVGIYGADLTCRVWDTNSGDLKLTVGGGPNPTNSAVLSPDQKTVLTVTRNGDAILWSTTDAKIIHIFKGHDGPIQDCDFSPDGTLIATGGDDGTVRIWDLTSRQITRTIRLHPIMGLVMKVRFTPDGRHLWTRNGNGTLYVLRLSNSTSTDH